MWCDENFNQTDREDIKKALDYRGGELKTVTDPQEAYELIRDSGHRQIYLIVAKNLAEDSEKAKGLLSKVKAIHNLV